MRRLRATGYGREAGWDCFASCAAGRAEPAGSIPSHRSFRRISSGIFRGATGACALPDLLYLEGKFRFAERKRRLAAGPSGFHSSLSPPRSSSHCWLNTASSNPVSVPSASARGHLAAVMFKSMRPPIPATAYSQEFGSQHSSVNAARSTAEEATNRPTASRSKILRTK